MRVGFLAAVLPAVLAPGRLAAFRRARAAPFGALLAVAVLAVVSAPSRGFARDAPARDVWRGVKVLAVLDGDTIDVDKAGEKKRIRFFGVDSPEKAQDAGQDAKRFMTELLADQTVDIEVMEAGGIHGRVIGLIRRGDVIANEELVRNGWGWVYRQYCKVDEFCTRWITMEDAARDARVGLWKKDNPTPPWSWRYIQRTVPPYAPHKGKPHGAPGKKGAHGHGDAPGHGAPAPTPGGE